MAKKRKLADLPPSRGGSRCFHERLSPSHLKRYREIIEEFLELRALGKAPRMEDVREFINAEIGQRPTPNTIRGDMERWRNEA